MKKIKLGNALLPLNLAVIVLVLVIHLLPDITALRVIFGLPFLLFFPGYTLILALFPRKGEMDGIERVALSFGLSFAVSALIGLGLNYTPWGIRLLPVLYAISLFVFLMSAIAIRRQHRLPPEECFSIEFNFGFPRSSGKWDRLLSIILALSICAAVGVLIYTVAFPRVGERFTEFYLLGTSGQAADYPRTIVMSADRVATVDYGSGPVADTRARLIIGIINREQAETTYEVKVTIAGQPVPILIDGQAVDTLGPITLANDEKYEQEIGFVPLGTGANQKVEFILLVGGQPYFEDPPYIWVDVMR